MTDAFGKVEIFAEGGLERHAAMVKSAGIACTYWDVRFKSLFGQITVKHGYDEHSGQVDISSLLPNFVIFLS